MPLTCGHEITENTTLEEDLTCDRAPALVIAADNVTLDLGGHTVSCVPGSAEDAPGILLRGVSGATVRNGTVRHFAAGIAVKGGGGNVVRDLVVEDNIGGADYGDGIVVDGSSDNLIEGNTVRRNGPFSGISLLNESRRNTVRHNVVSDNNMSHTGDPSDGRQDIGIRIEGPGASHNAIEDNTVTRSGSDGISVLPTCADIEADPPQCEGSPVNDYNRIVRNTASENGVSGRGDGIKVFTVPTPMAPTDNTIADNVADDNTTYGIAFDAGTARNTAARNRGRGNGQYDGFDGTDPPGDANTWEGNDFEITNHPYVGGRRHEPRRTHTDRPPLPGQAAPGSGDVAKETIQQVLAENTAASEAAAARRAEGGRTDESGSAPAG